jgi:hypothetical protein
MDDSETDKDAVYLIAGGALWLLLVALATLAHHYMSAWMVAR